MIALVLATALTFTLGVAIHFVVTHIVHNQRYVRNAFLVFAALCLASLPLAMQFGWLGGLTMYAALIVLWNSYLVFFINLTNSVSLRMIDEIDRSPTNSLSLTEDKNLYSDEDAFASRVMALSQNGFLSDQGEAGLVLTSKGILFAKFLEAIRTLFGIDSFG